MCTRSALFHSLVPTLGAKVTPKVAPRQAQGSPKSPKGVPKPPPGRLKIIKKSTWGPTLVKKGAREVPGVPPGGKMTPKATKKHKFSVAKVPQKRRAFRLVFDTFLVRQPEAQYQKTASIPYCFQHFRHEHWRPSTKKMRVFRFVFNVFRNEMGGTVAPKNASIPSSYFFTHF